MSRWRGCATPTDVACHLEEGQSTLHIKQTNKKQDKQTNKQKTKQKIKQKNKQTNIPSFLLQCSLVSRFVSTSQSEPRAKPCRQCGLPPGRRLWWQPARLQPPPCDGLQLLRTCAQIRGLAAYLWS